MDVVSIYCMSPAVGRTAQRVAAAVALWTIAGIHNMSSLYGSDLICCLLNRVIHMCQAIRSA